VRACFCTFCTKSRRFCCTSVGRRFGGGLGCPLGDAGPLGAGASLNEGGPSWLGRRAGPLEMAGPLGEPSPLKEDGPLGEPGPLGEAGPLGEPSPLKEVGPLGEPGPLGEAGPLGEPGPLGEAGPSRLRRADPGRPLPWIRDRSQGATDKVKSNLRGIAKKRRSGMWDELSACA
jgi:hypothetical protein